MDRPADSGEAARLERVRMLAQLGAFEGVGSIRDDVIAYESIMGDRRSTIARGDSDQRLLETVQERIAALQLAGEENFEVREAQLAALRKIVASYLETLE